MKRSFGIVEGLPGAHHPIKQNTTDGSGAGAKYIRFVV
jgi:hypothetical protein